MRFHKTIFAIINSHAARGEAGEKWVDILKHLKKKGFKVKWQFTQKKFHAHDIAREAVKKGAKLIISIGGDGTFNEIVNGVLSHIPQSKYIPELAIIPIGTGSDFSKTLKIPRDYKSAIDIIKMEKTKEMDVGKVIFKTGTKKWKRYFANVFDAGLGGSVVRIANRAPKILGGFLTFLFSSLTALLIFKRIKLRIWVDKKLVDHGLITIIGAANGQLFGGGMHIAPMALTDDGVLEFLYIKNTNTFKFLVHVLTKVYKGKHLEYGNVYHYRGTELRIECDKVCLLDIDGEEEKAEEVTISIIPKAIKVKVPY
ncbi:Diacylglycerol kinase [subsurface metagenome]